MSENILRVGKKGEIYTNKKLREKTGIRPGGYVRAIIKDGKLVIEGLPSIEELLEETFVELTPEEAEALSEKAQKEMGIYG